MQRPIVSQPFLAKSDGAGLLPLTFEREKAGDVTLRDISDALHRVAQDCDNISKGVWLLLRRSTALAEEIDSTSSVAPMRFRHVYGLGGLAVCGSELSREPQGQLGVQLIAAVRVKEQLLMSCVMCKRPIVSQPFLAKSDGAGLLPLTFEREKAGDVTLRDISDALHRVAQDCDNISKGVWLLLRRSTALAEEIDSGHALTLWGRTPEQVFLVCFSNAVGSRESAFSWLQSELSREPQGQLAAADRVTRVALGKKLLFLDVHCMSWRADCGGRGKQECLTPPRCLTLEGFWLAAAPRFDIMGQDA
ncbi:hypothetical protein Efla_007880 [Eimeria flavescens]